jgi:hypothetical protein
MEILKLKSDFEKLSIPTKIHRISQGKVEHFVYLGTNPMVSNTMVVLCSGDYTDAKCLRYPEPREFKFDDESEFKEVFVKDYNSQEVGEIMIKQLYRKIDVVQEIYIQTENYKKAKSFYGKYFEECKGLIDENGWLRICNQTPKSIVKFSRENRTMFESRTENTQDAYLTFIRPTCNLS